MSLFPSFCHTKHVGVSTSVTWTPCGKATASDFQLHLENQISNTLLFASAQLQAHPLQIINWISDIALARSLPPESPQAEAGKVLDGTHLPHWSKHPWYPQGAMAVHKFSLPDRHALPGLRKLLFSFKCMLCFSRENCAFFFIFIFMQCLSVFPPNLWLCQTASAKFKKGFYSFWICYLPPAIFICCHLIRVSEETVNCHCLCTFSLCFFPPRTSVYKLQSAEKTECPRIVKIK